MGPSRVYPASVMSVGRKAEEGEEDRSGVWTRTGYEEMIGVQGEEATGEAEGNVGLAG